MADRYWVGGTATWDSTTTANWSATSGGAGGASVPTSADNVFFDANSGTVTVTVPQLSGSGGVLITGAPICANLNFTGFTGTLAC